MDRVERGVRTSGVVDRGVCANLQGQLEAAGVSQKITA
jgi:hypothetical protein